MISNAKQAETPDAALTFSLSESPRATSLAKKLRGKSGVLAVELASFAMTAGRQKISESYLLMVGTTDSGEKLDHEQIRDLFDLACVEAEPSTITSGLFDRELTAMQNDVHSDVSERNSTYLLQQEELLEAECMDQQASYSAKIKALESQENTAKKEARRASDNVTRLRLRREALTLRSKIDALQDEYREIRDRLREESDRQLDLVEEALKPVQQRERLFTVKWRVL